MVLYNIRERPWNSIDRTPMKGKGKKFPFNRKRPSAEPDSGMGAICQDRSGVGEKAQRELMRKETCTSCPHTDQYTCVSCFILPLKGVCNRFCVFVCLLDVQPSQFSIIFKFCVMIDTNNSLNWFPFLWTVFKLHNNVLGCEA